MIYFIKLADLDGVEYNLNLAYVVSVSLPSGEGLNERIIINDGSPNGVTVQVLAGTWEAAIQAFFDEFDENPQPKVNVKDKVFVAST